MSYSIVEDTLWGASPVYDVPEGGGFITARYEVPWRRGCPVPRVVPDIKYCKGYKCICMNMVEIMAYAPTEKEAPAALDVVLDEIRERLYDFALLVYGLKDGTDLEIFESVQCVDTVRNPSYKSGHPKAWEISTFRGFTIWPPEDCQVESFVSPDSLMKEPWDIGVYIPGSGNIEVAPEFDWAFRGECPVSAVVRFKMKDGTEYLVQTNEAGDKLLIEASGFSGKGIVVRQPDDCSLRITTL